MMHREPNPDVDVQRTDEQDLLAELAYSPMFRIFVQDILVKRIKAMRNKLITSEFLPEGERRGYVMILNELKSVLNEVYEQTEAGVPPAGIVALFE
jgi:hypothetical protein